jgi:AraC-like DNA-binding protein
MNQVSIEISAELRELCLRVLASSHDKCRSKMQESGTNDIIASLCLDKYKNVVLCSDLAAAEAVRMTSNRSPIRAVSSIANMHGATSGVCRCNELLPVSRRTISALQTWRLSKVEDYIAAHISDTITLADLAAAAGLTRMYFAAQFRERTGVRPHDYVIRQRIARAQVLLMVPQTKIIEVGLCVGFSSQAHFTTVFRRYVGITPHRWRLSKIPEVGATPARAS